MADLPLPNIDDPLNAPFWRAAREKRLIAQCCSHCDNLKWPPRPVCTGCLRELDEHDWRELRQTGTVWSQVVYHRAFDPRFAERLPYTVAFVQLDDGPMFVTNLIGEPAPAIGDRVTAVFDQVTNDVTLIKFAMVS